MGWVWATLVDTALVAAGLHDEWIGRALPRKSEHRWLRSEGRRPSSVPFCSMA